jgi:ribonuclease HII
MIVGIDEVGRGCWAGPVVAGAVLLHDAIQLDIVIRQQAAAFGLGWVTPAELDDCGLSAAVRLAMQRALAAITVAYQQIIIDGNYNFLADHPLAICRIKADDSVPAVSAASIIAKVARDAYMAKMAASYPGYAFERHVGYGTAAHRAALSELGVSELHRRSFAPIRAMLQPAA